MSLSMLQTWKDHEMEVISCRRCERLVLWREKIALEKRLAFRGDEYWGKPVPAFGEYSSQVVLVGLAPGAHGSNRTGRMFTGDASGDFLFSGLYRFGFANQPASLHRGDSLQLNNAFITSVCHCAPPANKPQKSEIDACTPYLLEELSLLTRKKVIIALGKIAFEVINNIYPSNKKKEESRRIFHHGAEYYLDQSGLCLICSYHPSRQNTQTGRLTEKMADQIWERAAELCKLP